MCTLFFSSSSGKAKIEAYYGAGSGQIWLDSLECSGNEDTLSECPHEGWGSHDCSHSEDAGVQCCKWGEEGEEGARGRGEKRVAR